jgi:hypothetical protein
MKDRRKTVFFHARKRIYKGYGISQTVRERIMYDASRFPCAVRHPWGSPTLTTPKPPTPFQSRFTSFGARRPPEKELRGEGGTGDIGGEGESPVKNSYFTRFARTGFHRRAISPRKRFHLPQGRFHRGVSRRWFPSCGGFQPIRRIIPIISFCF